MKLKKHKDNWDLLGKEDPLWAVLTEKDKKGNKWEAAEFLATGKKGN